MLAIALLAIGSGSGSGAAYAEGFAPQDFCEVRIEPPGTWDLERLEHELDHLYQEDTCTELFAVRGRAKVLGRVYGYLMTGLLDAWDTCLGEEVLATDTNQGYYFELYEYVGKRQGSVTAEAKIEIQAEVFLEDADAMAAALGRMEFQCNLGSKVGETTRSQGSTRRGGPVITFRPGGGAGASSTGLIGYGTGRFREHVLEKFREQRCPVDSFHFTKNSQEHLVAQANGILSASCRGKLRGQITAQIVLSECGEAESEPQEEPDGRPGK